MKITNVAGPAASWTSVRAGIGYSSYKHLRSPMVHTSRSTRDRCFHRRGAAHPRASGRAFPYAVRAADDLRGRRRPSGDRPFEPMNQGTRPGGLPAEVLADVASVVGAEVTLLSRLPGGVNAGAMRVQLAGRANAVLKAEPRAHPNHPDETLRAQRVVEHMRRRGYPTPAWLGVGATATHVWHLMDFVDAAPVPELTPSIVEQLMEIIELQAGQASEPYDHWSYAWRVATGQEAAVAGLSGYSVLVAALVQRLRL